MTQSSSKPCKIRYTYLCYKTITSINSHVSLSKIQTRINVPSSGCAQNRFYYCTKSRNLLRKFCTKGRQTSILGAVAWPKNRQISVYFTWPTHLCPSPTSDWLINWIIELLICILPSPNESHVSQFCLLMKLGPNTIYILMWGILQWAFLLLTTWITVLSQSKHKCGICVVR